MVVHDCTILVADQYASLAFLAFVVRADDVDMECTAVSTVAIVESAVDIERP